MRVRVDREADALYVTLADADVHESEEVSNGIIVDFDNQGRVIGIEILNASVRTGNEAVFNNFSFDLPSVGLRMNLLTGPPRTR